MKTEIKKEIKKLAKKMSVNKKPKATPKIPPAKRNRRNKSNAGNADVTKMGNKGNIVANQYQLDPRQKLAWDYYIDPRSDTFSNAYQSAVKAGYSKSYSNHITTEQWWCERMRRLGLFTQSESVLEEMLNLPTDIRKYSYSKNRSVDNDYEGDEEEEVGEYVITDPALVRIKQDTAKFIAERLGKNEGYSTKTEVVNSGKIDLVTGNKALDDLFDEDEQQ